MGSSMTTSPLIAFFFCFLITTATFHACFCNGISSNSNSTHNITCFENERQALVKFKQGLKDPSNWLSSWDTEKDCCRWAGVVCDNFTGHVHKIRLRSLDGMDELRGKLNPSLLDLKHLQYLDLSNNDFEGTPIPRFIGSFTTLRYLNLSSARFGGTIPPQLGNLTAMCYLDLGYNYKLLGGNLQWLSGLVSLQHLDMSGLDLSKAVDWLQVMSKLPSLVELHLVSCQVPPYVARNLQWLSGLVSLQHLDMSGLDLSKAVNWLQVMSNLPSLVELHLVFCQVPPYVASPSSTNKINFTSLEILDLSGNSKVSSLPGWIFSLDHLVSLSIRGRGLYGPVPSGLQNMTSLRVLDLSSNFMNSTLPNWLYSLRHLESLILKDNNLQGVVSIAIENLTSLVSLDLSSNRLQGSIPTSIGKLCKLKTISLSDNEFSGELADIFKGFSRCKSHELETFSSSGNDLLGHLPNELGQLKSLASLELNANSFSGPIPVSIGGLSSLIRLDLAGNKLNGTLPESVGQLAKLKALYVTDNSLEGVISDVHFANLTRLSYLDARGNDLTLKASEKWVPPFQVEGLLLDSWQLGPQFPLWLASQRKLTFLSIANTRISDSIPSWFWPIYSKLSLIDLSRNQIRGEISSLPNVESLMIDLSSNRFSGSLPLVPSQVSWLDLSNNSFSGSVYHVLCGRGEEPDFYLTFLNLGNNLLSGKIPDCWRHWQNLEVLNLEKNNLEGSIPSSVGQLSNLQSLHLRHNNLSGELPQSLQNCSSLEIIELGENKLAGSIPAWMGNASVGLLVLNLRSNNFSGALPYELCRLSSLQILDVAHNNISGHVPRCIANFSAMAKTNNSARGNYLNPFTSVPDNAVLVSKGREIEYSNTLGLVTSMDLSVNNLHGEIPEEITKLVGLLSLNLSGNHLRGRIPRDVGNMRQLESLDFSLNQLSGVIPLSMSSLNFLSHLNLSYNNFTGTIPSSTQLQSMNESSFLGNKLCGPPLASCKPNKRIAPNVVPRGGEEEGDGFSEALFFASIALGFAVGFWVVLGPLLFKRSWRIAYFKVIEDIWNKVCDFSFECRYMFHKRE